jgi:hypothetical protein
VLENIGRRKGRNTRYSLVSQKTETDGRTPDVYREQSESDARGRTSKSGGDTQRGVSNIRYALDRTLKQGLSSAATSINSRQLPALFSRVEFNPGTVNLDIGGGKFDNAVEYLKTKGVTSYVYDPFNRTQEHNDMVAGKTENGQSDTVTISNVLNVIDSEAVRARFFCRILPRKGWSWAVRARVFLPYFAV